MTTLTTAPVAPLLAQLFKDAEAADPSTRPSVAGYWNGLTSDEKARLVRSRTGTPTLTGA